MKKILLISYYYPPLADVGGLRALGFSKYLPQFGWKPYVISVKNPDRHWCTLGNDGVPEGVEVFYTRSLMNLSLLTGKMNGLINRILSIFGASLSKPLVRDLFCIPDQFIGWVPLTFIKALKLVRQHNIDIIYVSCKPFSSAIVGILLKYVTKKPLVLELRDPVSPNLLIARERYYRRLPSFRLLNKIEEMVLKQVDRLILVTEETKKLYLTFFPFLKGRIEVIYNGFANEYFPANCEGFGTFTIVYSGNYYSEFLDPKPFFKALQHTLNGGGLPRGKIKFLYVGNDSDWLGEMINRYGLFDIVESTGHLPRLKSIECICRASILLLRIVPPMISTKLFEGLAAGVPILALINPGEVENIIKEYSKSSYYITSPDDIHSISEAIKDAYTKWGRRKLVRRRNTSFYINFNKRNLTQRLTVILNDVITDYL